MHTASSIDRFGGTGGNKPALASPTLTEAGVTAEGAPVDTSGAISDQQAQPGECGAAEVPFYSVSLVVVSGDWR